MSSYFFAYTRVNSKTTSDAIEEELFVIYENFKFAGRRTSSGEFAKNIFL